MDLLPDPATTLSMIGIDPNDPNAVDVLRLTKAIKKAVHSVKRVVDTSRILISPKP